MILRLGGYVGELVSPPPRGWALGDELWIVTTGDLAAWDDWNGNAWLVSSEELSRFPFAPGVAVTPLTVTRDHAGQLVAEVPPG